MCKQSDQGENKGPLVVRICEGVGVFECENDESKGDDNDRNDDSKPFLVEVNPFKRS